MNSTEHNLIMTATIDVEGCPQVSRNDVSIRREDYVRALRNYLTTTQLNIIFAENSGYDLEFIRKEFKSYEDRLELLSISENTARGMGKGHGEKDTILHCLNNSVKLSGCSKFFKVSGRYFSPDIENIIHDCRKDFLTLTREYSNTVTTVFFGCDIKLFLNTFSKETEVNDYKTIFEVHVANMINSIGEDDADRIVIFPPISYVDTYTSSGRQYILE